MLNISITGILLVWKPEYLWLSIPQSRAALDYEPAKIGNALNKIQSEYPDGSIKLIQIFSEGLALHKVFLVDKQYAWHDQQGLKIQQWGSNERIEDWLLDLHHRFLLGNTIGLNIAGFGGLLLLPLVIIGIFLWWPRRRLLKLGIFPKQRSRGVIIRSHFNLGSVFFLPILLLGITGVILVYPTQARNILLPAKTEARQISSSQHHPDQYISNWQQRLDYAAELYPNSQVHWVTPATAAVSNYSVGVQQADSWNRMGNTTVSFYPDSSVNSVNAMLRTRSERLMDFTYPLHVGRLPLWYRLLLTIFGIALMGVSGMGLWSYLLHKTESKPLSVQSNKK